MVSNMVILRLYAQIFQPNFQTKDTFIKSTQMEKPNEVVFFLPFVNFSFITNLNKRGKSTPTKMVFNQNNEKS